MVRATFRLYYFHVFLFTQFTQNFANGSFLFTVENMAAIFRRKYNVIFAVPARVS
jgi:hypothetical protein